MSVLGPPRRTTATRRFRTVDQSHDTERTVPDLGDNTSHLINRRGPLPRLGCRWCQFGVSDPGWHHSVSLCWPPSAGFPAPRPPRRAWLWRPATEALPGRSGQVGGRVGRVGATRHRRGDGRRPSRARPRRPGRVAGLGEPGRPPDGATARSRCGEYPVLNRVPAPEPAPAQLDIGPCEAHRPHACGRGGERRSPGDPQAGQGETGHRPTVPPAPRLRRRAAAASGSDGRIGRLGSEMAA